MCPPAGPRTRRNSAHAAGGYRKVNRQFLQRGSPHDRRDKTLTVTHMSYPLYTHVHVIISPHLTSTAACGRSCTQAATETEQRMLTVTPRSKRGHARAASPASEHDTYNIDACAHPARSETTGLADTHGMRASTRTMAWISLEISGTHQGCTGWSAPCSLRSRLDPTIGPCRSIGRTPASRGPT